MNARRLKEMSLALATNPLRCVINLGNPLLAQAQGDSAQGVSVDMAQALAMHLNTRCELLVVHNARDAVEALEQGRADVGFLAVDPTRAEHINFTAPYVVIEGCYLVPDASPLQDINAVDLAGRRVVVGLGSAYDLFLSRHLQHATLVRAASSKDVVNTFLQGAHDVAAGVKHQLETDMQVHTGLRLLPGAFMRIEQAMATPKAKGPQALETLDAFVRSLKDSGFLQAALQRHQVKGASLAP